MSAPRFERLLVTGAAGSLGGTLRTRLGPLCRVLRVTDRADLGVMAEREEAIRADLADRNAVDALVEGCDAIVHFGGIMREDWDAILGANVVGLYNLYEAARRHRVKRVVYASSNHATGFYGTDQVIAPRDPVRPDTLYGLSKTWGENIARLYFDRYGIETACLRIGSAFAEPRDLRMLATWLSYDDLERLVRACLTAPKIGYTILYGVSRNSRCFWDNTSAGHIGYAPQDSADDYREALEARLPPLDSTEDGAVYQGGPFVRAQPPSGG
jgi:uronate dehydrogenase